MPPRRQPLSGLILGCVVGHGPLAALITREELDDVVPSQPRPLPTHVYLRDDERSWSIEAVFPRIRTVPLDAYHSTREVREYRFDVPEMALVRVQATAGLSLGERYSLLGLFICWLYMERRWEWAGMHIPWKFCSQLATELLRTGDIMACPGLPADDVSPAHLEGWAASTPAAVRQASLKGR